MFLRKIVLTNFRQFYGTQELIIACDPKKNVTLIHAENGVGKTTILNALLWCFYKDTTQRFEQPDKMANQQAILEGTYKYKVEIFFENNEEEYLVIRECDERTKEEDFKAYKISNGNFISLPNPTVFVDSVIPREMAKYFFFDGEYAETFSSQNNKSKVREALEDMLGCRTANTTISDLIHIKGEFEKQIAILAKSDQSKLYQEEIERLEKINGEDLSSKAMYEENLKAAVSARDSIIEKLRGAPDASEIQRNREKVENELANNFKRKKKQEAELTEWINDLGIGLISERLEEKTKEILENAKLKGKIPSYIAETFVEDILSKKICICERPFEEQSPEAQAVSKLLQDAGSSLATDRLMNARALAAKLSEKRRKSLLDYRRIKENIESLMKEIMNLEAQRDEYSARLRESGIEEIEEREKALEARHREIKDLSDKITRISYQCENRSKEINTAKSKRDKMLQTNSQATAIQKRVTLLNKTVTRIEEELEKYRENSRSSIAQEINKILEKTARRDYIATIDERFNLDMRHRELRSSVARSSGENQLLSLAFMASLIKFSADRIENSSALLKPGTSSPLVLDSPFGQLDPAYQKSTSEFLPEMANQVILLLSKTQGNTEVLLSLKDKIGKEYILISENTTLQGDKPSDYININGQKIASSLYGCDKNLTSIKSV